MRRNYKKGKTLKKMENNNRKHKKTVRKHKVHFNLKKNKTHSIPKTRRKTARQQGGNILPQTLSNTIRWGENSFSNTINTLKGKPLLPSPYPTNDQVIDQNAIIV